ncbi:MAG: glycosyltransferase family 4 protein [Enterococcus sp.]|nr:glycosyltransferase family 4 protein [Enterococcus sp.]
MIFGQPFNTRQGGGITLSNLFKGWDKDRIAVAATGHVMKNITTDVCETNYCLGSDEFRWHFPFNLLQRKFQSGLMLIDDSQQVATVIKKSRLRSVLVDRYFYPALEWFGLFHNGAEIRFSDNFRKWLEKFNPQILYLQVSTYDEIKFARVLIKTLEIPSIIHMMDDWPSTISTRGPFKKYWQRVIDSEFRELLDEVDIFFSIGEAMTEEYRKRYSKEFIPFHNPIDVSHWQESRRKCYKIDQSDIRLLYSGRIGVGISESLIEVAEAVESLNQTGLKINLHIQSASSGIDTLKKLMAYKCVKINPYIEYSALPGVFSGADILLIANDFDPEGVLFLRYSMPTKASEYMISATPVLVYSHGDTAISRFFSRHNCGLCVTEHANEKLIEAIKKLVTNEDLRKTLGTNAFELASRLFDGERKRKEFRQLIRETTGNLTPYKS